MQTHRKNHKEKVEEMKDATIVASNGNRYVELRNDGSQKQKTARYLVTQSVILDQDGPTYPDNIDTPSTVLAWLELDIYLLVGPDTVQSIIVIGNETYLYLVPEMAKMLQRKYYIIDLSFTKLWPIISPIHLFLQIRKARCVSLGCFYFEDCYPFELKAFNDKTKVPEFAKTHLAALRYLSCTKMAVAYITRKHKGMWTSMLDNVRNHKGILFLIHQMAETIYNTSRDKEKKLLRPFLQESPEYLEIAQKHIDTKSRNCIQQKGNKIKPLIKEIEKFLLGFIKHYKIRETNIHLPTPPKVQYTPMTPEEIMIMKKVYEAEKAQQSQQAQQARF